MKINAVLLFGIVLIVNYESIVSSDDVPRNGNYNMPRMNNWCDPCDTLIEMKSYMCKDHMDLSDTDKKFKCMCQMVDQMHFTFCRNGMMPMPEVTKVTERTGTMPVTKSTDFDHKMKTTKHFTRKISNSKKGDNKHPQQFNPHH